MKRLVLLASVLMFSFGCSQQRAADQPNTNNSNANNSNTNNPNTVKEDPAKQAEAQKNGEKFGEKARDLEQRTRPEREKLAKNTADAAEKMKQESLKLGDRAAAAAQGVKAGWNKSGNGSNAQVVDINSADTRELQSLPGMTLHKAQLVISSRPYASPQDLVSKRVLSQADYNRIKDRVTATGQSAKQ